MRDKLFSLLAGILVLVCSMNFVQSHSPRNFRSVTFAPVEAQCYEMQQCRFNISIENGYDKYNGSIISSASTSNDSARFPDSRAILRPMPWGDLKLVSGRKMHVAFWSKVRPF